MLTGSLCMGPDIVGGEDQSLREGRLALVFRCVPRDFDDGVAIGSHLLDLGRFKRPLIPSASTAAPCLRVDDSNLFTF
jgi:hypothetical protein